MSDVLTGKDLSLTSVKGQLLTTKEIAVFLRTSEKWVINHMKDGTFPFDWYQVGDRNHVADKCDLDRWLSMIKVQAGTAPVPKKSLKKIKEEVRA